jgi:hypothetical protein
MWIGEAQRLRDRAWQAIRKKILLCLTRMTEPGEPLRAWQGRLKPAIEERASDHILDAARRLAPAPDRGQAEGLPAQNLEVIGETAQGI